MEADPETPDAVIRRDPADFARLAATLTGHAAPWCVHGSFAAALLSPVPVRALLASPTLEIVLPFHDLAPVLSDLARQEIRVEAFDRTAAGPCPAFPIRVRFDCSPRYQTFLGRATARPMFGRLVPVAAPTDVIQALRWTCADPDRDRGEQAKASLALRALAYAAS